MTEFFVVYKLFTSRGLVAGLVYKLFLQAGTALYKVLIKQRNLKVLTLLCGA